MSVLLAILLNRFVSLDGSMHPEVRYDSPDRSFWNFNTHRNLVTSEELQQSQNGPLHLRWDFGAVWHDYKAVSSKDHRRHTTYQPFQFRNSWNLLSGARSLMMTTGQIFRVVWCSFRGEMLVRCRVMPDWLLIVTCDGFFSWEIVTWPTCVKRTVKSKKRKKKVSGWIQQKGKN